MKEVRIYNLYSGSGGNSTFIRIGQTAILIDAGRSAKALRSALSSIGEDISSVNAIFVTHEHNDHISALEIISKKNGIPIFITCGSAKKLKNDSFAKACAIECDMLFCKEIGEIKITSFPTMHDSLMSVGYRIEFEDDGVLHAIGYATDIGCVSDEVRESLLGCEAVIIEANHDVSMLMTGPYSLELKQRVNSNYGHLSNDDCADFVYELVRNGTRAVMLAHLSRENNTPEIARETVSRAITRQGVSLCVANPNSPVELVIPELDEFVEP